MYYSIEKMKENELCQNYNCYNHEWVNIELPCGCIIAICLDINVDKKYIDKFQDLSNKINVIDTYLKHYSSTGGSLNDEKIVELLKEKRITNSEFMNIMSQLKEENSIGDNVDFNGEYLFLKLLKGEKCTN
jgi:hypothetical protein